MKDLICCLGFGAILCLTGCIFGGIGNLQYCVGFENIGLKDIKVREMIFCKDQLHPKLGGELWHGVGGISWGVFTHAPDPEITLEWTDMETGESSSAKIKIQPALYKNRILRLPGQMTDRVRRVLSLRRKKVVMNQVFYDSESESAVKINAASSCLTKALLPANCRGIASEMRRGCYAASR